jgi:hypothetical protein
VTKLIHSWRDMVPLICMSVFVSRIVAEAMTSSNSSLPWMKVQMNVRRRLQFLNHEMIGGRVSSVSDLHDLSRGEIWGGEKLSGPVKCGTWSSVFLFGSSKRGSGGRGGSISLLIFNVEPGFAEPSTGSHLEATGNLVTLQPAPHRETIWCA